MVPVLCMKAKFKYINGLRYERLRKNAHQMTEVNQVLSSVG